MRKCILIIAVLCLLFALTACTATPANDRLQIVCSVFPQYDFLREITRGANVELTLLLRAGQESHHYDPSSQDIAAVHNCDMFVYVGGESDSWIDKTLQSVDTAEKTVLKLVDMVEPHENHDGHDHGYDEHVWTSPANAVQIVQKLLDNLCALDPVNTDTYRANAAAYIAKLTQLDTDFQAVVNTAARRTIVVADRFPLLYFCERYGLTYHAAFAGCAAAVEPASADVQALIDTVNTENIPLIFQMELSAGGVAKTVEEHTGCKVATFYACHNLSKQDMENGETYLSLMQKNLITLKEALN